MQTEATSVGTRRGAIVATLGPASLDAPEPLVAAGASALRLNASHMSAAALRLAVARVRATLPTIPIVVDLQGAKMRLGRFSPRPVRVDEIVSFGVRGDGETVLPLPHPELFASATSGETLSLDDGRIRLTIVSLDGASLCARAESGGEIRPRKGVNVVEHPVALEDLTGADQAACEALAGVPDVSWAISFVADALEAEWVRRRVGMVKIIGKVERRLAIENLHILTSRLDEIWICRGDLGVEVGLPALARFVAAFDPAGLPVPVLMAGQVLEHMTTHDERWQVETHGHFPPRGRLLRCHGCVHRFRRRATVVLGDIRCVTTPLQ